MATPKIDWGAVGKRLIHPMQKQILEELARQYKTVKGKPMSATSLKRALGEEGVARIAYHLQELLERGWVVRAGERKTNGATEKLFELNPDGIKLSGRIASQKP